MARCFKLSCIFVLAYAAFAVLAVLAASVACVACVACAFERLGGNRVSWGKLFDFVFREDPRP